MKRFLAALIVLVAACSNGTTGPKPGLDPIMLVTNHLAGTDGAAHGDTAYVTWVDQSGQMTVNHVPPLTSACVHFTPTTMTDSVQFTVAYGAAIDGATSPPGWAKAGPSIWLLPGSGVHEDWTADIYDGRIPVIEVAQPPC